MAQDTDTQTEAEKRAELGQRLGELGRQLSTVTVMLHHDLAQAMGIGATDGKALDFAFGFDWDRVVTAGQLAESVNLTSGAATALINRLEAAGFISREPDPSDRRKVLIRANINKKHEFAHLYKGLIKGSHEITTHYSVDELHVIFDFLERTIAMLQGQVAEIRS